MLATISCSLYRVVQWTRKLGHKKPEEKPPKRKDPCMYRSHRRLHCTALSALFFFGLKGTRGSFFLFRSVPFQYVRWFRFGFSHKPKSRRLDGRPLFFFSRPRPNVSRLRRPGAVRAQPCNIISMMWRNMKNFHRGKV